MRIVTTSRIQYTCLTVPELLTKAGIVDKERHRTSLGHVVARGRPLSPFLWQRMLVGKMEVRGTPRPPGHSVSVFAHSCLSTPINAQTGLPANEHERGFLIKESAPQELTGKLCTPQLVDHTLHVAKKEDASSATEERSAEEESSESSECSTIDLTAGDKLQEQLANLRQQQQCLLSVLKRMQSGQHGENESLTDVPTYSRRHSVNSWAELEKVCSQCETDASSPPTLSIATVTSAESSSSNETTSLLDTSTPTQAESERDLSAFVSPAVETISSMWDDFSVEDYIQETSMSKASTRKERRMNQWVPRITKPEPFSMTMRDEGKAKKRSRAFQIAEEERLRKEVEEEAECSKQFCANAIPASTYLPLYEIIVAKNEHRRKQVKEKSKEWLSSQEKPFSFLKREQEKSRRKCKKIEQEQSAKEEDSKKHQFHAHPVPSYLYDTSTAEKIMEEEEYRKIRLRMRAEGLLLKSKLPGNMHERNRARSYSQKRREDPDEGSIRPFHPAVNKDVPDFGHSQTSLQRKLCQKKATKHSTVVEPFYLRAGKDPSSLDKVRHDIMVDEATLPETRWPFTGPRQKVYSLPQRPKSAPSYQKTEATKLREAATREKLAKVMAQEEREEEERRRKLYREQLMRRELSKRITDYSDAERRMDAAARDKMEAFR